MRICRMPRLSLALLVCSLASVAGCGRHVDDRMTVSTARALPAGYEEGPEYAVIATRTVPTARVVGNYVLITNGRQPVYVLPGGYRHVGDASLEAHVQGVQDLGKDLDQIQSSLDRLAPPEPTQEPAAAGEDLE
jgi:hypothetical protein